MGRNTYLCKEEMCFILLGGASFSFLFLYTGLMTIFTYIVLIFDIYIYDDVYLLHLPLHVLFLFYLYTHVSYSCMQYVISVSHKVFLAIDSLLAKFFKSLC